ncbi:MAG: CCA tRNA nucleotidyltransferase [Gemmatimonadaceae bacterium]
MSIERHPLRPPRAILSIARRLREAGFETWCVGGAVRDALLGQPHLDWDLATRATPAEVQSLFRRTVPVGVEFGTVGVLDDEGVMHEVTTFRRDVRTDGRHAEVEFGGSLDDDLARRDFTVNAIAYEPHTGELRDPFEGRADLERGVIRAVGDPDQRMREDRLRALRAIRFAARFGFRIEGATWDAIVRSAPHLGRLSPERVQQELDKTMRQANKAGRALQLWRESGALATLIPPLAAVSDVTLRSLDVLPRPLRTVHDRRRVHRLTALFADVPAKEAERSLRALRFSNVEVTWIAQTLAKWQGVSDDLARAMAGVEATPGLVRRWVASVGRLRVPAVWRLAAARHAASLERDAGVAPGGWGPVHSLYRRALLSAARDPVELADLAVDGDDLRAAGVPAGRLLGQILGQLLDEVVEEPSRNTRDWLLARAAALYEDLRDSR